MCLAIFARNLRAKAAEVEISVNQHIGIVVRNIFRCSKTDTNFYGLTSLTLLYYFSSLEYTLNSTIYYGNTETSPYAHKLW